jgi:flagellar motor protein MotB
MRLPSLVVLAVCLLSSAAAAEPAPPFSQTMTAAQKQRLGLDAMTPAQLAELDAAVAVYASGEKTAAVSQAVAEVRQQADEQVRQAEQKAQLSQQQMQQAQEKAAETAVEEYKKKQEPGVIARTLEIFKRKQEEEHREHFIGHVVGEFRGWNGGTYFPLTDGQVWRQVGTDIYELRPVQNAEVEIFKSKNGYWRLKYAGAWITVKRLQ